MNRFGLRIEKRWRETAPLNYATIENKTEFFTDLGKQVEQEMEAVFSHQETKLPPTEDYLTRVGQLRNAQMTAQEIALANVPWPAEEMTEAEARQEWEMVGPEESSLWQLIQYEPEMAGCYVEYFAEIYLMPEDWLRKFNAAADPVKLWEESTELLEAANEARYQRWKAAGFLEF